MIFKYLEDISDNSPVVELREGYGKVILNFTGILNKAGLKLELYTFGFTENGQECIWRLDPVSTVKVGFCDFDLPFTLYIHFKIKLLTSLCVATSYKERNFLWFI